MPFNRFIRKDETIFLEFQNLANYSKKIKHCFTTKEGGVSNEPYKGLNLGFSTEDAYENVLKNRQILANALDLQLNQLIYSKQVHGNAVRLVTKKDIVEREDFLNGIPEYDAMITADSGVFLMGIFADCVPVYFYDTQKNIVALAHSGWKGTQLNIAKSVVEAMGHQFSCNPKDLEVVIGPSIGRCCFEVGAEVMEPFREKYPIASAFEVKKDGSGRINLPKIIRVALQTEGVSEEKIKDSGICTTCNKDLFYSYRGEKGLTGRMAGIIGIK